jgi:hypothetical protein
MKAEAKHRPAPPLPKGAALALALWSLALGAAGCFDVRSVDPGPLLIDNFDNGPFPADSTFSPWMCFSYPPGSNQNYSCKYDTDTLDGSAHSLRLDFHVDDPPDDTRQYGGVGLVTYATPGLYQDVTALGQMGFDAEVQSGLPSLPSDAALYAVLGCSTVQLTNGTDPGDYEVLQAAPYDSHWGKVVLSLANFGPLPGDNRQVQGGVTECLRRIDAIRLQVDAELLDGGSGAGTLKIDNVFLR